MHQWISWIIIFVHASDLHTVVTCMHYQFSQTPACECPERPSWIPGSMDMFKISSTVCIEKTALRPACALQGFFAVHCKDFLLCIARIFCCACSTANITIDLWYACIVLPGKIRQFGQLCNAHTKRHVKQPWTVPHKSVLCCLLCRWPLYAWWCCLSLEHCTSAES